MPIPPRSCSSERCFNLIAPRLQGTRLRPHLKEALQEAGADVVELRLPRRHKVGAAAAQPPGKEPFHLELSS